MEQTVYLDLLFLINFSMDFLTFYLASKILSLPLSMPRALVASALGGIYADASLFLPFGYIICLACDLIACSLMCAVAYGKRGRWSEVPFYSLVYFAVSMALGGFMTAIFNLLNRAGLSELFGAEDASSDGISLWLFFLLAAISGILTFLGGRFFRRRSSFRVAELTVSYDGKQATLRAFVDSGNLLREPIGGRACVVVSAASLDGVLPSELMSLSEQSGLSFSQIPELDRDSARRIRLIPSKTANGEGMMLGVIPDALRVKPPDTEAYEVEAVLVLSSAKRFSHDAEALLPSELLL